MDRELERKKRAENATEDQIKPAKKLKLSKQADEDTEPDKINKDSEQDEIKKDSEQAKIEEDSEQAKIKEGNEPTEPGSDKKSHLDQLKVAFNQLSSKPAKKKRKKKEQVKIELKDEDNLDLKLDRTVSIALPASIILNAQTPELKAYLIGQVARCAAIFNVNEIVVFDEYCTNGDYNDDECEDDKITCVRQMASVLRYLECPQYLRKSIFPIHKDFRFAGLINPLDTKHHLRYEDESEFREGVVNKKKNGKSFVYVGLQKEALINKEIEPGTRVTVQLDIFEERNYLNGKIVSPYLPTKKLNYYWGYDVRVAKSLSKVMAECPFDGKYDLLIGTSDKGDKIEDVEDEIDDYKHALIVFGGLKGIEFSMSNDPDIEKDKTPRDLFNYYLNACPNQGTNTIRTEEAITLVLSSLKNILL